ncbi:MAG: universal stress protein [Haloarculaceae archaeon]
MTFVVPFDGSRLAEAALVRAVEFSAVLEERVVAVTVIPNGNAEYARERGWLDDDEPFAMQTVVSTVHTHVADLAPAADFQHEVVERYATSGTVANRLRDVAADLDASMVFVGSDDAGHLVTSISSVGSSVAADAGYDVAIIRHARPSKIGSLRDRSPHRRAKSDFYLPE